MDALLATLIGYLTGSIPFAHLLSRRRGVDLRRVGSGNVGATNVLRTSGVSTAVLTMVLDAAKGSAAVLMASLLSATSGVMVVGGIASIVGHVYPVWLGFRGGKGVATAAGVFLLLAPMALVCALGAFVVVVLVSGYISLGSLVAAATLAVTARVTSAPAAITAGAAVAAIIVLARHIGNIRRLRAGTERRLRARS